MDQGERKTQHLRQFLMREASLEEIENHLSSFADDERSQHSPLEKDAPSTLLADSDQTTFAPPDPASSGEIALEGVRASASDRSDFSLDDEIESAAGQTIDGIEESQADALEALVLKTYRPMIDVTHNTFAPIPGLPWNDSLEQARQVLERIIPAVGRVEIVRQFSRNICATGVLVAADLFLTSQSSLASAVQGSQMDASFLSDARLEVDFSGEIGSTQRE